jgi:hypothetical protein
MTVAPVRGPDGDAMCEKCVDLDKRIEHYQRMTLAISDQLTVERIKELIGELQAEKTGLHPQEPK